MVFCFRILSLVVLLVTGLLMVDSRDQGENCTTARNSFADATSRFSSCAIFFSRPITFCENCIDSYLDVLGSYNNLSTVVENRTKCIDKLVNLDRLEIVETFFQNSCDLWNRAKCYECFQIINNTLTPKRSKETLEFNKYYNRVKNCLHRKDLNDTSICDVCLEGYINLNEYYESIANLNEKIGVCIDLVDQMNDTRIIWSKTCTRYRVHDEYLFIGCTSLVLVITVLFYVLTQMCSTETKPTIIQQRRLAESLSYSEGESNAFSEGDNTALNQQLL